MKTLQKYPREGSLRSMSTKNCAYMGSLALYISIYLCSIQQYELNISYHITTFVGLFREGHKLKQDLVTPPGCFPFVAPFPTAVPHVVVLKMPVRSTISVSSSMVTNWVHECKSWYMKKNMTKTQPFHVIRLSCHLRIKQQTQTHTHTHTHLFHHFFCSAFYASQRHSKNNRPFRVVCKRTGNDRESIIP